MDAHPGSDPQDVIDVLTADHREIESMLRDDLPPAGTGVLVATLVRHAVAEQEYVYPTVAEVAPNGERLADRGRAQHAQLDETIQQLSTADPSGPEFRRLLRALAGEVRRHLRYDVAELFPTLRRVCTRADLARLGERVAGTQPANADTRFPPPRTVRQAPPNFLEQVRDLLLRRAGR